MKFRLQLVTVNDSGQEQMLDIAQFEREGVTMESLGLSLAEGKGWFVAMEPQRTLSDNPLYIK